MTIYKSSIGKEKIMALYDEQLERLKVAYFDKWVFTSFGDTHLIETGNLTGISLLVFHGVEMQRLHIIYWHVIF